MKLSGHLRMLFNFTIGWVAFVIIGLPQYYQHWPFKLLLYFCIAVYFGLAVFYYTSLRKHRTLTYSIWLAFYTVVPLCIYDYFYINFVLNAPYDLLNRFWFLSIFYIVPWFLAPATYLLMFANGWTKKSLILLSAISLLLSVFMFWKWAGFRTFFDLTGPNISLLGASLRFSIFGAFLLTGVLSLFKAINKDKIVNGK